LSKYIAPGLKEVGIFLPYSPLHHILMHDFARPLVATSGNISGDPVLTENVEAQSRLNSIADAFLHHNRLIARPSDDSVVRRINHKVRPLRIGRGYAPLELPLEFVLQDPIIAVGGHLKNTVALAWGNRIVISPHIGEMSSLRSLNIFEQTITDLQKIYDVKAKVVLCDAHPGYATTRWAKACGLDVRPIFHHRAHASALIGEHSINEKCLVFTWDGTGFGEDSTLWGGETLLGIPGNWQRVASMRAFYLPGGEKVMREPWRSVAAVCWETGKAWVHDEIDTSLLFQAWQQKLNCPQSTAVGRLFDAAAVLVTKIYTTSYEAQGPMQLEALCKKIGKKISLPLIKDVNDIWRTDWEPLITFLQDENLNAQHRAEAFHASIAHAIVNQALKLREEYQISQVGLTGGVFQNRVLTEQAVTLLEEQGFGVYLSEKVPCNDAGISYGQVMEYGSLINA
jgi:hydrogenase maturation protein HypF